MKVLTPRVDRMFRAFSDGTRLRILSLLRCGELCVCDLVNATALPQPTISRHLAYLRRAGLVAVRKEGLWCHYKLTEPSTELHQKLIECLDCCGESMPAAARDAKRLQVCGKACCD